MLKFVIKQINHAVWTSELSSFVGGSNLLRGSGKTSGHNTRRIQRETELLLYTSLILIVKHYPHLLSHARYPSLLQETVSIVSSIFRKPPRTHFLRWREGLLSHCSEDPLLFVNDVILMCF